MTTGYGGDSSGSRFSLEALVGAHLGHNARVADHVILANSVLLGGYAEMHNRVFIGGGGVFHQFTRMDAVSLLQGNSGIGKDIPPFSIAIGKNSIATLNVIGLRRTGFSPALRNEMRSAFDLLYGSGLNAKQALEESEKRTWVPETMTFWIFVATSKRGICPMGRWKEVKSEEQ